MQSKIGTTQYTLYWVMFFFILAVSCADMYLIVRHQTVMHLEERNHIGLWLIALDGGGVGAFCAVKMFGTCVALGVLKKIWLSNRKWGWSIGFGMSTAQAVLLWFLFC